MFCRLRQRIGVSSLANIHDGGMTLNSIPLNEIAALSILRAAYRPKHEVVWTVRSKPSLLAACILALMVLTCGASRASAQLCPPASGTGANVQSAVQSLEGWLIYHDGIRRWFELKLDKPKCGEHSIQILPRNWNSKHIEVFRGCRVRSTGSIDFSPTGYYSLNLYEEAMRLEPVGSCGRKPRFPKEVAATPDAHVRSYTVDMHVDYRPGDHPVVFHVRSAGKELRPWQAYASYMLTGGFVLYGHCGDGFAVDRVYGTPEARPSDFDTPGAAENTAMFDPERAAQLGKSDLHLGYSCIRVATRR
jgi:hypothetical protein